MLSRFSKGRPCSTATTAAVSSVLKGQESAAQVPDANAIRQITSHFIAVSYSLEALLEIPAGSHSGRFKFGIGESDWHQ